MPATVLPIHGASRAKRIAWSTPPNQISAPYLKMLRERNKGLKVYDVNPYVEVVQFYDNLYGLLNPNCDGGTDVWSWLLVGPKSCLLIGTGFGLGDLPGLVEKIAGRMPVTVVNSHSGRGQVLGNSRFNKVYCHEYETESIRRAGQPGIDRQSPWDSMFDSNGSNRWMQFDRKDLPVPKDYELTGVKDGHTFRLGDNYDVELVWTGGHTPGHAMFLDKQSRRLFCGDDVSSDTIRCGIGAAPGTPNGQYATLTAYRERLTRLIARLDDFDYLFPAHGFVNLENRVLGDSLATLDQIIARPEVFNYQSAQTSTGGGAGTQIMEKYIPGFATIAYTQGGVSGRKG